MARAFCASGSVTQTQSAALDKAPIWTKPYDPKKYTVISDKLKVDYFEPGDHRLRLLGRGTFPSSPYNEAGILDSGQDQSLS